MRIGNCILYKLNIRDETVKSPVVHTRSEYVNYRNACG